MNTDSALAPIGVDLVFLVETEPGEYCCTGLAEAYSARNVSAFMVGEGCLSFHCGHITGHLTLFDHVSSEL